MTESEWQALKVEALAALHRLITGSMVEEIQGPNNTRTRFMKADIDKLQAYIVWIDGQISITVSGFRHRPIYFTPDLG